MKVYSRLNTNRVTHVLLIVIAFIALGVLSVIGWAYGLWQTDKLTSSTKSDSSTELEN